MKFAARCSWLLVGLLGPIMAVAHDARPNYVQITETADNTFSVNWKVPASMPGGALPYPMLPADCAAEREPAWQQASSTSGSALITCCLSRACCLSRESHVVC